MIQDRYLISKDYRMVSTELLVDNLPSLRARISITQEELANLLGISRQTYYSLESGKREMSWPIFLSLVFIFNSIKETSEMLKDLKIYPIDLIMQLNDEYKPPANDDSKP